MSIWMILKIISALATAATGLLALVGKTHRGLRLNWPDR